jgi:alkylation response protein AidB-like acyl-CoA dehydrogenase
MASAQPNPSSASAPLSLIRNPLQDPLGALLEAEGPNAEIVARARRLKPLIKQHAQQSEDDRRVAEPVIKALDEAGLFHISIPRRLGGQGANFRTFLDTIAAIGEGDGGTAWAAALLNVCTWFGTLFSDQAQKDVWGSNPKARICGIFTPPQITERVYEGVEGGVRVTGEWGYASGSNHADWAVLGVKLGDNPDGSPILGLGLIPMSDLSIKQTWYVAGMRASGSNTLVADNVFVPDHRIQKYDDMANEDYLRTPSENNDWASFIPVAELILVGAQIGLAREAINITIEKGGKKNVAYTVWTEAKNSPAHQIALAEAVSMADEAWLLVARACADIDLAAARHEKLDMLTRARIRMDTGRAAKLCRESINRLMSVNGAASFANVNALQRIWRDSEISSRHAFVMPEVASHIYGRALFGIEEIVQPF